MAVSERQTTETGSRARLVSRPASPAAIAGLTPLAGVSMFVVAFLLRYVHIQQAYDIFIDEVTYARISESVASHHTVEFFGAPFFLHPPVAFFIFGFFIDAFHIHGSAFAVVFALRSVNAFLAAGSAVCLLALGKRIAGWPAGFVAGGLFAIDPFLIRFDGRVFLEPATLFFVCLGYLLLVAGFQSTTQMRAVALSCSGLTLGIAILTNEMAAPLIGLPLGLCLALGWPLGRRDVLVPVVMVILVLGAYVGVIVAVHQTHNFVDQQILGLRRLSGADQMTGFNKPGAPSLLSRIDAHLSGYGGVYVALALSLVPVAWFLRRGSDLQRLSALIAVSAYVLLAYQVTFGTIEEQMFYYADVPAILVIGCGAGVVLQGARERRLHAAGRGERARVPWRSLSRSATVVVLLAILAADARAWVEIHTTTDAALQETIRWVDNHVPAGTRIAPLVDTAQLLVNDYQVVTTETPAQIESRKPAYVLTSTLQVSQGYGYASPKLVAWLRRSAVPVASYSGRTFGRITIWSLPDFPRPTDAPPGFSSTTAHLPRQPVGEG